MDTPASTPSAGKKRRLKIRVACQSCRNRKIKCDGVRPTCNHCLARPDLRETCSYRSDKRLTSSTPAIQPRHSPIRQRRESLPALTTTPYTPAQSSSAPVETSRPPSPRVVLSGTGYGHFADRFDEVVGGRLSLLPANSPSDAPLFRFHLDGDNASNLNDAVLPPRKHADHLVKIYWQHVHTPDPFLDRRQFDESYTALFAGTSVHGEEALFLSTLNIVFALATQVQYSTTPEKREETSSTYFRRAWAVLRTDDILWGQGSLELIQCLLLMSQYLQWTNNLHQNWMAMGSAMRIAESMRLYGNSTDASLSPEMVRLRQHVWRCCVFMDKKTSWSLERPSRLSQHPAYHLNLLSSEDESENCTELTLETYLTKTLEIYEIGEHVLQSQLSHRHTLANRLGLPSLYRDDNMLSTVMMHENCISKWEERLPECAKLTRPAQNISGQPQTKQILLQLRLLHTRIIMYRPMLARVCFSQTESSATTIPSNALQDRSLLTCASLCIESAQKCAAIVYECYKPGSLEPSIPWWYRVFYSYVPGVILFAAMLKPELFSQTVNDVALSWDQVMFILTSHEHLSPFVESCASSFSRLSGKLADMQAGERTKAGGHEDASGYGQPTQLFQDLIRDLDIGSDEFSFGMQDLTWLLDVP